VEEVDDVELEDGDGGDEGGVDMKGGVDEEH
jgi:hypothetical protein